MLVGIRNKLESKHDVLVDLVHGCHALVGREAILAVLGASQCGTKIAVEMGKERAVTPCKREDRSGMGLNLTIVNWTLRWRACSPSKVRHLHRRGN